MVLSIEPFSRPPPPKLKTRLPASHSIDLLHSCYRHPVAARYITVPLGYIPVTTRLYSNQNISRRPPKYKTPLNNRATPATSSQIMLSLESLVNMLCIWCDRFSISVEYSLKIVARSTKRLYCEIFSYPSNQGQPLDSAGTCHRTHSAHARVLWPCHTSPLLGPRYGRVCAAISCSVLWRL